MWTKNELKDKLREAGMRATAPRVALLQLMAQSNKPMTHTEVVEALGQEDWDQATLYRNLIKFTEDGLIRVASQLGGQARYELVTDDHHDHIHPHFVCNDCGQVECLPATQVMISDSNAWQAAIQDAMVEIVGTCPTCRTAS